MKIAEPAATKGVAVVNVSSAPPPPTTFKPMGFVEKAGGKLEAIILQENEVQVVHINDLIAGRFRVTKISPDSVDAIDETLVQSPMAKPNGTGSKELTAGVTQEPSTPPVASAEAQQGVLAAGARSEHLANTHGREAVSTAPADVAQVQPTIPSRTGGEDRIAPPQGAEPAANSLGYVQEADGKIETIVADGDTVRLVPETPTVTMAQVAPPHSPEGASPPQGSPPPALAVSSTREANADSAVHPGGVSSLASMVREASYQVPMPALGAAEGSALDRLDMGSLSEAAATADAASDSTPSIFTEESAGSTDGPTQLAELMIPLGFIVKADGDFAAILSDDDGVYIVRQGDRLAGRYRALSVSADAVEVVEDPPRQAHPPPFRAPPAIPDLLSASAQQEPTLFSKEDCLGCLSYEPGEVSANVPQTPPPRHRREGEVYVSSARGTRQRSTPTSKKTTTSPDPVTFVFQTLGYVETQDGEMRAIVADGSQVYLVKEGEIFADQYRATSVDPALVLAVRATPGQEVENFLSAQTESGGEPASNRLYGYLHFPLSGLANVQALDEMGASGSPGSTGLGVSLLNSSLTGFDLQSHFFMADDPSLGF
jgi:Tfp pilus assembly protein PilP